MNMTSATTDTTVPATLIQRRGASAPVRTNGAPVWLSDLTTRVPRMTRALASAHATLFLRSHGLAGGGWFGMPILVLETVGRRSGRPRTNPVVYVPEGNDLVVVPANAGDAPAHPSRRPGTRYGCPTRRRSRAIMPEVELSAGTIEYEDTGGDGPVLVFTHGLLMDGSLWRHVITSLRDGYRCITPTLPLGGQRRPMHADADLSLRGIALLIEDFLEALELHDVTLIQNDWGGVQILLANGGTSRITRLVLTSCEAFDNYPPRPARPIVAAARIPGGLWLTMAALRLRLVRRAPRAWGWMSKRPVDRDVMDAWFRPATTSRAVRRDLAKYVTSVPPGHVLTQWASRSAEFAGPVLVAWAAEDKMMPPDHGRRLADLFPDGRLVEIRDSYTLIPEDQPDVLTGAIREFLLETQAGTH